MKSPSFSHSGDLIPGKLYHLSKGGFGVIIHDNNPLTLAEQEKKIKIHIRFISKTSQVFLF